MSIRRNFVNNLPKGPSLDFTLVWGRDMECDCQRLWKTWPNPFKSMDGLGENV